MMSVESGPIYASRAYALAALKPGMVVRFVDAYTARPLNTFEEVIEEIALTEYPTKSGAPEYVWLAGQWVGRAPGRWHHPVRYDWIIAVREAS